MRYLNFLKIDAHGLFRSIGVDPGILRSPDDHLALETYIAIEDEAARISGDPYFGLHMGELAEPGNYSILGYVMMNSSTLGEALMKGAHYYRIIGSLMKPLFKPGFNKSTIIMTTPKYAPKFSRHCFEAAFSTQVVLMRKLTGRRINPLEVGFSSAAPEAMAEYERVFGCPVLFCQKYNYITLENRLAGIPILQPNPDLLELCEGYARELLTKIEENKKTTGEVTRVILEHLTDKRFSLRSVAGELSMSVRTLQNRLHEEGEQFSRLMENIRMNLAKKYLKDQYTVEDITALLGFSEPSVFRKAFKKWMGTTPREYRETLKGR